MRDRKVKLKTKPSFLFIRQLLICNIAFVLGSIVEGDGCRRARLSYLFQTT